MGKLGVAVLDGSQALPNHPVGSNPGILCWLNTVSG